MFRRFSKAGQTVLGQTVSGRAVPARICQLWPDGALLVPERAVTLDAGEAWPVLATLPADTGLDVTLAHRLGPLHLTLSPREAALLEGGLVRDRAVRAEVNLNLCPVLPEDRLPDDRE